MNNLIHRGCLLPHNVSTGPLGSVFHYADRRWACPLHLVTYQKLEKYLQELGNTRQIDLGVDLHKITQTTSGKDLLVLERKIPNPKHWEVLRYRLLLHATLLKLTQKPAVAEVLQKLPTGPIYSLAGGQVWGVQLKDNTFVGENLNGKILQELRPILRHIYA